jgi:protein-tyrosine-phosphatase
MKLLVCCAMNRCRSPLAAALLRQYLSPADHVVASAGVAVQEDGMFAVGSRASRPTRDIARAIGLDLESHRSQGISSSLIAWADLILYMDNANRKALDRITTSSDKLECLGKYADPPVKRAADPGFLHRLTPQFMAAFAVIVSASYGLAVKIANGQGKSVCMTAIDRTTTPPDLTAFNKLLSGSLENEL